LAFSAAAAFQPDRKAQAFGGPKRGPQSSLAIVLEGVLKRFTLVLVAICAVGLLTGCYKNPTISPLFPPTPPTRMFVADLVNGLVVFNAPVTSSSVPAFTIAGPGTAGVVFDSAGNLYVSNLFTKTIAVYKPTVTSSSTPTFTIGPITGASTPEGMAFGSTGNLYVADEGAVKIHVFTPPFAGGAQAPALDITGMPFGPVGVTFDRAGDLLTASYGSSTLTVFRPPYTSIAATIALPTGAGGVGIDTKDHLVIGQADGSLAIFTPPFATGNTPAEIIAPTFLVAPPPSICGPGLCPAVESLNSGVDPFGNVWVPYGGDGGLAPPPPLGGANQIGVGEFVPPFTGVSVSNIGLLQNGLSFPFSIAWGR
jgi:hypothetical protein